MNIIGEWQSVGYDIDKQVNVVAITALQYYIAMGVVSFGSGGEITAHRGDVILLGFILQAGALFVAKLANNNNVISP